MKVFFFILLIFSLALASSAATYVAVVETVAGKDVIGHSEKMFLTDRLRSIAQKSLPAYMDFVIMTRENINAMLPPGKSIEDCEGSCLAETGRNISADYISQARVGKFGDRYTLTVELYETKNSNLVGSFTALSDDDVGLLQPVDLHANDMFESIAIKGRSFVPQKDSVVVNPSKKKIVKKAQKKVVYGRPYLVDDRNNKLYRLTVVGSQVWMSENLNYKRKNSWCFNNDDENCRKFGRLYTLKSAKKACPNGWRLPTISDVRKLVDFVGGNDAAGDALKAQIDRDGFVEGDGKYKFGALLAGYGLQNSFAGIGKNAYFWVASEKTDENYMLKIGESGEAPIQKSNQDISDYAFSVRCIEN